MSDPERVYREAMNKGHEAAWDLAWDRAARFYAKALEVKPGDPQALVSLGLAYYEMGRWDEAARCYTEAAQKTPDDPVPWEKLVDIFERRGELRKAVQAALRAAEAHARRKDFAKAVTNWVRVTRLEPENLTARSRLALVYERTKQIDKAAQEYVAVASVLQRQGRVEEARQAVARAAQLLPQHPEVRRAQALLAQGKPLPPPPRVRGGTGPLRMARIRQLERGTQPVALTEQEEEAPPALDPIAEARQKALTALAELLFEEAEAQREPEAAARRRRSLDALIVGMPTSPAARAAQRQKVILLLSQAVDLQTQGKLERAAAELEQALKAGLDHPAVHFDLGLLFAETGRLESAARLLKRSMLHPDYALASHLLLGRVYLQQERLKEAAQEYLAALREADAQVVASEHQAALRQLYEPALAELEQADEERWQQVVQAVRELLEAPGWQERVRHAREQLPPPEGAPPRPLVEFILQGESTRVVEALARINALRRQGKRLAAMEEAHLALRLAPTYLPLHALIGEMLEEEGMHQAAKEKYATVARSYVHLGQGDMAVRFYQKALALDPMDLDLRLQLIEVLVGQERLGEAVAAYVDLAEAYYRLAELHLAEKTYKEALRLANRMGVEGRSWQLQILQALADLAEQALDWEKAARYYEQLRTLAPEDQRARRRLVLMYARQGEMEWAVQEIDETLAWMSQRYDTEVVLTWLTQVSEDLPQEPEVLMRLARWQAQVGQTEAAIATYDRAGEAFLERDDIPGAIRAVQAILALNPPQAADYEEALAALQERLRARGAAA